MGPTRLRRLGKTDATECVYGVIHLWRADSPFLRLARPQRSRIIDGFCQSTTARLTAGSGRTTFHTFTQPGAICRVKFFSLVNINADWSRHATGTSSGPSFNFSTFVLQDGDGATRLEVKLEQSDFKTERTSPEPEPDQTEPVDLSLNKPRSSAVQVSKSSATVNPAPSSTQPSLSATPVPSAVQSIGSMVTPETPPKVPRINHALIPPPPLPRPGSLPRVYPGHSGRRRPADPPRHSHDPLGQHAQQGGAAADHPRGGAVAACRVHHHAHRRRRHGRHHGPAYRQRWTL